MSRKGMQSKGYLFPGGLFPLYDFCKEGLDKKYLLSIFSLAQIDWPKMEEKP
jgi:hypothetical protein